MDLYYALNCDEERQEHMRVGEDPHHGKVWEVLYEGVLRCALTADSTWKTHASAMLGMWHQHTVGSAAV